MARKKYRTFVEKGVFEGRRADLTGGGLLRSFGGWTALKALRKAGLRVKGDERILGDSDFVTDVLKIASETLEQKYDLIAEIRLVEIVGEASAKVSSGTQAKIPWQQVIGMRNRLIHG